MAVFNPNYFNPYGNVMGTQNSANTYTTPNATLPSNGWSYQPPTQPNPNSITWVQGRAGANVMLMDSTESVLYVKSADSTGRPMPLKIYDLVERTEAKPVEVKTDPIDYDKIRSIITEEVDSKLKAERSKKGDKH